MSRRAELISPEGKRSKKAIDLFIYLFKGLRLDGRRVQELRCVNAEMGVISGRISEGSSSYEIGNTRILATVFGPRDCSTSDSSSDVNMSTPLPIQTASSRDDEGKISVKIHAASFSSSGGERRKNTRQDR
jgi:ribonuclease PH